MKKIISVFVSAMFIMIPFSIAIPAQAAKSTCATIKSGTIKDSKDNTISVGYDKWGYNYQAHSFNGWYDNYSRPDNVATSGDILQMKWNDAWLSNKDCYGADNKLDRPNPYIGSGAWLTNHISGTYESETSYHWDVTGDWVITVNNGAYPHDYTFTMTSLPDGTFTGIGGYPAGGSYSIDEIVTNGQIIGDTISFTATYYQNNLPTGYSWNATGIIASNGSMSGTGDAGVYEWHNTSGVATKVMNICTWTDFVKIVAVPVGAFHDGSVSGYYGEGMWYEYEGGPEIGPTIWGEFAVIQEVSEDPCGEVDLMNYKSELRSGLGNW